LIELIFVGFIIGFDRLRGPP